MVMMANVEKSLAIQCTNTGTGYNVHMRFGLNKLLLNVRGALALKKQSAKPSIGHQPYNVDQRVEEERRQIRQQFITALESVVFALESKDKSTLGRSRRVCNIAEEIGRALGLSQDKLEGLHWASSLHDIGNVGVDQVIQNKRGKLDLQELYEIERHAELGSQILTPVFDDSIIQMVRHHHDHYDGHTFGQTLTKQDIPLGARIMAVADAFDAMTCDRPHRPAISIEQAVAEIKRCSGTQFDPLVVSAFLNAVNTRRLRGVLEPA